MNAAEIAGRQFKSELAMVRKAIELCPEELWLAGEPNRYWHLVYHILFYTHFYLAPSEAEFVPWPLARADYHYLGEILRQPVGSKLVINQPYTRDEMLAYHAHCVMEVDKQMGAMDLEAPSGFYWLPFSKLELQFYNLRHIAHHTGQLADRLRTHADIGVAWVR